MPNNKSLSLTVLNSKILIVLFYQITGKPSEVYRGRLGAFGVSGDLALRPVTSLSGGQKSRVAFAIMDMAK